MICEGQAAGSSFHIDVRAKRSRSEPASTSLAPTPASASSRGVCRTKREQVVTASNADARAALSSYSILPCTADAAIFQPRSVQATR